MHQELLAWGSCEVVERDGQACIGGHKMELEQRPQLQFVVCLYAMHAGHPKDRDSTHPPPMRATLSPPNPSVCLRLCPPQAQMELELIERLKAKQMEQRRAYQQLEAVLSLGSARWVQGSDLQFRKFRSQGSGLSWWALNLAFPGDSWRAGLTGTAQTRGNLACIPLAHTQGRSSATAGITLELVMKEGVNDVRRHIPVRGQLHAGCVQLLGVGETN